MNLIDTPSLQSAPASRDLIVIERTHHSQTEHGLALLNHIANARDGCSFDVLYTVFVQAKGATASVQSLRSLLGHLVSRGYVAVNGRQGAARLYTLGDMEKRPTKARVGAVISAGLAAAGIAGIRKSQAAVVRCAPSYSGQIVPPRQYDVMCGPVYAPPRSAAPRAGSLDFKRVASHGYGC